MTEMAKTRAEAARVSSMMEQAPINVMFADREFKIRYVNPASIKTLKEIEHLLPIKADQILGTFDRHLPQAARAPAQAARRSREPAASGQYPGRPGNARAVGLADLRPQQSIWVPW